MTTETDTIARLAGELYDAFETRKRDDGKRFVALRDGSPQWMADACHTAHGDMMPDDWRYESIRSAAAAIHDNDGDEDGHDFADSNVDVYNSDRHAWLASHLDRAGYVDEAVRDLGGHSDQGIDGDIGLGQYAELLEVYGSLYRALSDHADTLKDDDES